MKNFSNKTDRRKFLLGAAALSSSAFPSLPAWSKILDTNKRILVVFELSGGNDGLNTHVPFENDAYYRLRPKTGIKKNATLKLDREYGFNKSMSGMQRLWQDNSIAVIKGCGYPRPSFSHFTSNAYMHSGVPHTGNSLGWVGRLADNMEERYRESLIINIAAKQSPAVVSRVHTPIVFQDPARFQRHHWMAKSYAPSEHQERTEIKKQAMNENLSFIRHVDESSRKISLLVDEAWKSYTAKADYGIVPFGLQKVAACIKAGFDTQLYYVSVPNNLFDTHVYQGPLHRRLLSYTSDTIYGFFADLKAVGLDKNVVMLVYSEFGRRPKENNNLGTDHGTANDIYLIGPQINGGIYGKAPDLEDLTPNENLRFTTDFRRVYATVIEDWLGVRSETVLGTRFEPLKGVLS
ncbi:MAG TPA: hypothetical protein DCS39_02565 [Rhodobiaceae bacterium]|nr:hypothetical protein [Rhodobiaceae bacterium]